MCTLESHGPSSSEMTAWNVLIMTKRCKYLPIFFFKTQHCNNRTLLHFQDPSLARIIYVHLESGLFLQKVNGQVFGKGFARSVIDFLPKVNSFFNNELIVCRGNGFTSNAGSEGKEQTREDVWKKERRFAKSCSILFQDQNRRGMILFIFFFV